MAFHSQVCQNSCSRSAGPSTMAAQAARYKMWALIGVGCLWATHHAHGLPLKPMGCSSKPSWAVYGNIFLRMKCLFGTGTIKLATKYDAFISIEVCCTVDRLDARLSSVSRQSLKIWMNTVALSLIEGFQIAVSIQPRFTVAHIWGFSGTKLWSEIS